MKRELISSGMSSPDNNITNENSYIENINECSTASHNGVAHGNHQSSGIIASPTSTTHSAGNDSIPIELNALPQQQKSTEECPVVSQQQHLQNYDADVHGTPLHLLRIPILGLSHISKMIQDDASIAQYTDDSSSSSEITRMGFPVTPVSIDVGYVCKICQIAWPRYHPCLKHMKTNHVDKNVAIKNSSIFHQQNDDQENYYHYMLKIEQVLHRCDECNESFATLAEVLQHARGENACRSSSASSPTLVHQQFTKAAAGGCSTKETSTSNQNWQSDASSSRVANRGYNRG
ncbi:hypothetical protein GJ496_005934 [Pomphorhynchus laevis]|nr:hypothetical protein GJ496_005934 [Pomphorhynchus laevis]